MEKSNNDILLSFFFFAGEFNIAMARINVSNNFFNMISLFKQYKDIVHISTIKLACRILDPGGKSWTLSSRRWDLDSGLWTLDAAFWTLNDGR